MFCEDQCVVVVVIVVVDPCPVVWGPESMLTLASHTLPEQRVSTEPQLQVAAVVPATLEAEGVGSLVFQKRSWS